MTPRVPILTWHSLDDSGSVISTSPAAFRAQVRRLREQGYEGVTLRELIDGWDGRAALPPRPVALTFDDGFRSVLEVAAPVLGESGFRATVFVVARACGGRNDWPGASRRIPTLPLLSAADLLTLIDLGHEVGAHGLTHRRLDVMDVEDAEGEIAGARARLEDAVGCEVTAFAYPYGRTSEAVRRQVAAHYRAACTDELRVASAGDDRHALGRLDMYYFRTPVPLRLLGTRAGEAFVGLRRLGRRIRALA